MLISLDFAVLSLKELRTVIKASVALETKLPRETCKDIEHPIVD